MTLTIGQKNDAKKEWKRKHRKKFSSGGDFMRHVNENQSLQNW